VILGFIVKRTLIAFSIEYEIVLLVVAIQQAHGYVLILLLYCYNEGQYHVDQTTQDV